MPGHSTRMLTHRPDGHDCRMDAPGGPRDMPIANVLQALQ